MKAQPCAKQKWPVVLGVKAVHITKNRKKSVGGEEGGESNVVFPSGLKLTSVMMTSKLCT